MEKRKKPYRLMDNQSQRSPRWAFLSIKLGEMDNQVFFDSPHFFNLLVFCFTFFDQVDWGNDREKCIEWSRFGLNLLPFLFNCLMNARMSTQRQVIVRDLVEEAKKRIVMLVICVVGLSYLMSCKFLSPPRFAFSFFFFF
jgi:hypothetical protein